MNDPEPVRPALSATGDILHWMMVKIPAGTTALPEGAGAAHFDHAAGGRASGGAVQGPGRPGRRATPSLHVDALCAQRPACELAANADRAAVMAAMEGKVLARAIFGGRFMQTAAPAGRQHRFIQIG